MNTASVAFNKEPIHDAQTSHTVLYNLCTNRVELRRLKSASGGWHTSSFKREPSYGRNHRSASTAKGYIIDNQPHTWPERCGDRCSAWQNYFLVATSLGLS